jgi:hypothetical protein
MEADGIGPALVRSLTSRALTRHALVRSCRDRATGPQNAKKLFRHFCAGKELKHLVNLLRQIKATKASRQQDLLR